MARTREEQLKLDRKKLALQKEVAAYHKDCLGIILRHLAGKAPIEHVESTIAAYRHAADYYMHWLEEVYYADN